jgi:hypothetical protein
MNREDASLLASPQNREAAPLFASQNREAYLTNLMHALAPLLEESLRGATATMDTWRVSVGFPGGGNRRTRIGECWGHTASSQGLTEIFISPVLGAVLDTVIDDDNGQSTLASSGASLAAKEPQARRVRNEPVTARVLPGVGSVLLHEMLHAALGQEAGHGKSFKRLATDVGLVGPVRSTVAGEKLSRHLSDLVNSGLGEYPHAPLTLGGAGTKPQTTRLLKASCNECGYTIRLTQKWVAVGLPTCPCGCLMESK